VTRVLVKQRSSPIDRETALLAEGARLAAKLCEGTLGLQLDPGRLEALDGRIRAGRERRSSGNGSNAELLSSVLPPAILTASGISIP
jgi:hypothetical protein